MSEKNAAFKVIIADDKEEHRQAVETNLKKHFPAAEIVFSGENIDEALKRYRSIKPELIFLDIAFPGQSLNGIGVAELIWSEFQDARVIFVSSHTERVYVKQVHEIDKRGQKPAYGWIVKDHLLRDIDDATRTVLAGRDWVDHEINRVFRVVKEEERDKESHLNERLYEALVMICLGMQPQAVAKLKFVTKKAIEAQEQELFKKLNIPPRGAEKYNPRCRAAWIALKTGIVDLDELKLRANELSKIMRQRDMLEDKEEI